MAEAAETARARARAFHPQRWAQLARTVDVDPRESVCVALSGGADSVHLLHVVCAAAERPHVLAVHVDHGLRGAQSAADARFCAELTRALGASFELCTLDLDPAPAGLEARARSARYSALARAARAHRIGTILTAHHKDDALETLLLRWVRGGDLAGLPALRPRLFLRAPPTRLPRLPRAREALVAAGGALVVARPLLGLRRAELRAELAAAAIPWREDASNGDPRFARNALRGGLLPAYAEACGAEAIEHLHAFADSVARLEDGLAARAAGLAWLPPRHALARGALAGSQGLRGGTLPRAELARFGRTLARRALSRLIAEASAHHPRRAALDRLLEDLYAGRTGWHELSGGWRVQLRSDRLDLEPPAARAPRVDPRQLALPFPEPAPIADVYELPLPGEIALPDGRRLTAELVARDGDAELSRAPCVAEVDARSARAPLVVRWPRHGDRFHALGAPGSKPLVRFLADAGVPRHDRHRVPLVCAGEELLWVAGLRPSESARVRPTTRERLVLRLAGAAR